MNAHMECAARAALWFRQRTLPFFLARTRVRAFKAVLPRFAPPYRTPKHRATRAVLAPLPYVAPHSHKMPLI